MGLLAPLLQIALLRLAWSTLNSSEPIGRDGALELARSGAVLAVPLFLLELLLPRLRPAWLVAGLAVLARWPVGGLMLPWRLEVWEPSIPWRLLTNLLPASALAAAICAALVWLGTRRWSAPPNAAAAALLPPGAALRGASLVELRDALVGLAVRVLVGRALGERARAALEPVLAPALERLRRD